MGGNQVKFHERRMLYLQVRDRLMSKIEEGVFVPGEKVPSEREISDEMEVSRYTARRAIQELVDEGILYRVQGSGTYIKEVSNNSKRLDSIGVIMPFVHAEIEMMILNGMQKALRNTRYSMMLYTSDNNSAKEAEVIFRLREEGVAGLVLMPSIDQGGEGATLSLKRAEFPFVLVDRGFEAFQTNCVVSDNQQGGNKATRHLLALGHKKICFLHHQLDCSSSIHQRLRGFQEAFRESGLEPGTVFAFDDLSGSEQLKVFLEKQEHTAVVTGNANVAEDLIKACLDLNIAIPGDLSVVSFDDIKVGAKLVTSVIQLSEFMGEKAVELLLGLIENDNEESRFLTQIYLPTKLVPGDSCKKLA